MVTSSAEKPLSNLYLEQSKDNDNDSNDDGNDGNNKLSFDDDDEDTVC